MSTQGSSPVEASDCNELRELLPAYIAGALTPKEVERTQGLLDKCLGTRVELDEYVALTDAFSNRIAPVQPPTAVHDRLMSQLSNRPAPVKKDTPAPPAARRREKNPNFYLMGWLIAGLLGILLVGTNLAWANQLKNTMPDELFVDATQEAAPSRQQLETLVELVSEDTINRVVLLSTGSTSPMPRAAMLWQPDEQSVLLISDNLPDPGQHKIYQLWLIGDDDTMSAGIFQVDDSGIAVLNAALDEPVSHYHTAAITVEPEGGSTTPTTDPIATAKLTEL